VGSKNTARPDLAIGFSFGLINGKTPFAEGVFAFGGISLFVVSYSYCVSQLPYFLFLIPYFSFLFSRSNYFGL
jgi:hypothetical protein